MSQRITWFDVNGQVGCGRRERPEFRTCLDRLPHMDRLGIDRALVWSVQGRDQHAPTANRLLLAELDAMSPQHRRRFEPSLVVSSSMCHETGTIDELARQMRTRGIRALWTFPAAQQFRLNHLDDLLAAVRELKPVLLTSIHDLAGEQELLDFAARHGEMPIVVTSGMWPHLYNWSLLNVLAKRPNVVMDNSWHHTAGSMEYIVRKFGSGRILFGTGPKAHNGAAMGQVLYAEMSEQEKHGVAHEALERLLGLSPTQAAPECERPHSRSEYWQKVLQRRPMNLRIFDAHGHTGHSVLWPMVWPAPPDRQLELALRDMDRSGVETIIVSDLEALYADPVAGNLTLERQIAQLPGAATPDGTPRVLGYYAYPPHYAQELAPAIEDAFSRKFFVGFKFLCGYWGVKVTDPRLEPALEYANRHRLPILIHTWGGPYDSPAMLTDIVPRFPEASFILGHSGGGDDGRLEAVALAKANPNVYLEWCGSFCSGIAWEETITQVGNDRVVFGSDAFIHDFWWELGRFYSLDLPPATLEPILGANMRKILARRK